jgi:hypothetical protein
VFINVIQMLMVIRLMNLLVPQTFYVFLRYFSKSMIDYIPNLLKDLIAVAKNQKVMTRRYSTTITI